MRPLAFDKAAEAMNAADDCLLDDREIEAIINYVKNKDSIFVMSGESTSDRVLSESETELCEFESAADEPSSFSAPNSRESRLADTATSHCYNAIESSDDPVKYRKVMQAIAKLGKTTFTAKAVRLEAPSENLRSIIDILDYYVSKGVLQSDPNDSGTYSWEREMCQGARLGSSESYRQKPGREVSEFFRKSQGEDQDYEAEIYQQIKNFEYSKGLRKRELIGDTVAVLRP